jgi:hypothetical protein
MSARRLIHVTALAALGALALLSGLVSAQEPKGDAAEVLELKVLGSSVQPIAGNGFEVHYQMEVLSVLSRSSRVNPGESISVRTSSPTDETFENGLMVTGHLDPDPTAAGPSGAQQFVTVPGGPGLVPIPPGPPSLTFEREVVIPAPRD